ncbi:MULTISPECIES: SixA phosphatase family protein [unclassified Paraflavitalea]|uniref:SixA phosphatase family protein n=1 Tax=unclassified Paraflavitalea TaxID=2798305 RepID=UPI003D328B98
MKQLVLVRHAKSSWELGDVTDFNRTLNERGLRDAPEMAARVKKRAIMPDLIITSTAVRAKTTATIFKEILQVPDSAFQLDDELYLAEYTYFMKLVASCSDDVNTLMLFSHNPGITAFAYLISSKINVRIDDIPTCGVFSVHIDTEHWKDFLNAPVTDWFFDYPKLV